MSVPRSPAGEPVPSLEGMEWVLGVDIGGTNLKVGMVPVAGGHPQGLRVAPTHAARGADTVVKRVVELCDATIRDVLGDGPGARAGLAGVGIGSPGPLRRHTGVVVTTPNLGWTDFPIRKRISGILDLPAALDNDANCAVYGEWWMGAGQGARMLAGLTLGTGVGGGIVLGGEIFHGVADVAGELGHMSIHYDGRRCGCGNRGCLEAYCSGTNIAARAVEALERGEESVLREMAEGDLDRITAATVSEAAVAGDPFATALLEETARLLAVGVSNLMNVLNPDRVVIAGGVTRAGDHLFGPLQREVADRAFATAAESCEIVAAELPETAGVLGAAGMFLQAAARGEPAEPGR